ncbi:MAG TPA: hypothetical protein VJQ43_02400 [Thermoplasmata archaeon]|nr:hypothetical protein [Thermoplasmata archaeon]
MTVDFEFGKAPKYTLATIVAKGKWTENMGRPELKKLMDWAAENRVKTGKVVFRWRADETLEVGLEIRGKAKTGDGIRRRTLPATSVARVTFDPDAVSPRVVYHGLSDWLRWRKKDKEVKSVGSGREIYRGDPWTNKAAWKNTSVEFAVRR